MSDVLFENLIYYMMFIVRDKAYQCVKLVFASSINYL